MLPGNTLASVNDWSDGTKKEKGRVTINACVKLSKTMKFFFLFIGKFKKPCCFWNLNVANCY